MVDPLGNATTYAYDAVGRVLTVRGGNNLSQQGIVRGAFTDFGKLQAAIEAQGLACRGAGGWRMEAASFAPEGGEGPYRQAADDTPPALERAVRDRLGDAAFLKPDEEKQLISNGWRKSGQ